MSNIQTEDNWSAKEIHRPRLFKDFIGQDTAISILNGQIKNGKFSRSYLFTGAKGDGKTSLANALARKINSTKDFNHPNINNFNAIVSSGVDDIRNLLEKNRYAPLVKGKRIVIVDEAHGLSQKAGGALLIDLENPPEHLVWMLCTNEPQKLLPTVRDRCKKIELKPLKAEHVTEILIRAATKEEVFQPTTKYNALFKSLGNIFEGRNRDALNTLSNLADISRTRDITKDDIAKIITNVAGLDFTDAPTFLGLMYTGKSKDAFEILSRVTDYNSFSYILLDLNTHLLKQTTGLKPPFNYGMKTLNRYVGGVKATRMMKVQRVLINMREKLTSVSSVNPEAILVYFCMELAD